MKPKKRTKTPPSFSITNKLGDILIVNMQIYLNLNTSSEKNRWIFLETNSDSVIIPQKNYANF